MKRRDVLRKTGAGLAASTAAMGVVGARTDRRTLSRDEVPSAARSLVADHQDLLGELVSEGLLERSDLDVREADLTTTKVALDHDETWHAGYRRSGDDGDLTVHVLPEFDLVYATLEGDDGTFETFGDSVSASVNCPPCYYELCYCAEPGCDPYCCEAVCTCMAKCCGGGPCPE